MTEKALRKLPDECKNTLETISELVKRMKIDGNISVVTEYSKKLKGYLECLQDINIITQSESRCLYQYYVSVR